MSKRNEINLTHDQKKLIEDALIRTIKQDQNSWLYDKNNPKHRDVKNRAKWFESFGKSCNPPVTGKQASIIWNKVVNRYSSAVGYYNSKLANGTIDDANKIQSKTFKELSFLKSCCKNTNELTFVLNQQDTTPENDDQIYNQINISTNIENQMEYQFDTNSSALSDSNSSISLNQNVKNTLNSENKKTNSIIKTPKTDSLLTILENLNEKVSNKACSNPQIIGFESSIIPLLENYLKISNNDILALEDLKIKVVSLIINETRELQRRMTN